MEALNSSHLIAQLKPGNSYSSSSSESEMLDFTVLVDRDNDSHGNFISPWDIYANKIQSSWNENSTWPAWNSDSSTKIESFAPIQPSLVGAGLSNLGNTCFLNAVLQCFTHTVLIVQELRSLNHIAQCNDLKSGREGFCLLCHLMNHIELSLRSSGRVVSPFGLVDNLSYFSTWFQRYQQEDAHEFLQCLLDRLESCCLGLKKPDNNLVKGVFGGRLVSKLRCCGCGHQSDTYEPLIDLSLEIEDVNSLQSALQSFTKLEKIDDPDSKFICEKCKEQVCLEKQFVLDKIPPVVAFHLKRFKTDGTYVEKVDSRVEYPLKLDLLPYTGCRDDMDNSIYELYAIVVHIGLSSTSGHYFCFIRSSPDTWYKLDDSKVTRVEEETVLRQEAYILFYTKQGTPWPSSLVEAQIQYVDSNTLRSSPKSVLDDVDPFTTQTATENLYRPEVPDNTEPSSAQLCSPALPEVNKISGDRMDVEEHKAEMEFDISSMLLDDEVDEDTIQFTNKLMAPSVNCERTSETVEENDAPTSPCVNNCNEVKIEMRTIVDILPQTPPRPSSADTYLMKSKGNSYLTPRRNSRSESQISCKRALDKSLEDAKRKEALKTLKRTSMPMSRRMKLMAVMEGSPNIKKNKEKARGSPYKKISPCRKPRHKDVSPVATAIFR